MKHGKVWIKGIPLLKSSSKTSKLTWIKSGEYSEAIRLPYEIYQKMYRPVSLSVDNIYQVQFELVDEFYKKLDARNTRSSKKALSDRALVKCFIYCIIGKGIETWQEARKAYRGGTNLVQHDTDRRPVSESGALSNDILGILNDFIGYPSGKAWLVEAKFTVYLDEEEEQKLYKGTRAIELKFDPQFKALIPVEEKEEAETSEEEVKEEKEE